MAKVRNLSDTQQQIAFTEHDFYQRYIETFKTSEFGRIKSLLPLHEMAISFGLIEDRPKSIRAKRGRKSFFTPEGKVADAWKPYMKNLDTVYTDASCYESSLRFPTDVKLLWECVERAYKMMCGISSQLGEHRLRTKYNDIEKANLAYRKQRKHTHKQTRKIIMRLLALLGKILGEIRRQMRVHPNEGLLNDKQLDVLETITRVYRQQKNHFKSGDSRESIPNRIVSISKPFVRPIVRGKENKIETSFTQNGRTGKNEVKNATKRELARVRATAMEGSFGTQKEHYGLRKIAARIKSTEIMLIFFGIHTANVVNLARRESVQVALAA